MTENEVTFLDYRIFLCQSVFLLFNKYLCKVYNMTGSVLGAGEMETNGDSLTV
jgi:hypothetical protein